MLSASFGYAYYQEHADELRAVSVDGVAPSAETVDNGEYPLARPLYIYTTAAVLQEKPQVAAFVDYYLNHVNAVIDAGWLFPGFGQRLVAPVSPNCMRWSATVRTAAPSGNILMAGSSTVFPSAAGSPTTFAPRLYRQHQHQQRWHRAPDLPDSAPTPVWTSSTPAAPSPAASWKRAGRPSASRLNSGSATMPWQSWSARPTTLSRTFPWPN